MPTAEARTRVRSGTARTHALWLAAGLMIGFAVPFLGADRWRLPHNVYYGIYAITAVGFFLLWARATAQDLPAMLRRRRLAAVLLGLLCAALLVLVVIRTEPPSSGVSGVALFWDVLWRGVVYGAVDGLLLSAFPILAVFAATDGSRLRASRGGVVVVGIMALLASMVMTAVYHLGYSDFRSPKLAKPVLGDVVWSAPTLLTLNPIGAPIAHAGLHVAAVLRAPQTETFLPPHRGPAPSDVGN